RESRKKIPIDVPLHSSVRRSKIVPSGRDLHVIHDWPRACHPQEYMYSRDRCPKDNRDLKLGSCFILCCVSNDESGDDEKYLYARPSAGEVRTEDWKFYGPLEGHSGRTAGFSPSPIGEMERSHHERGGKP